MTTEAIPSTARLLITAATLAYGFGPFVMDMNKTHLLHPKWTGHARFHLLWAAVSQLAVCGLALWLLWSDAPEPIWKIQIAGAIGLCMNSGFLAALIFKKYYHGTLHDEGGIPPIRGKVDGNLIAVFLIISLLVAGLISA